MVVESVVVDACMIYIGEYVCKQTWCIQEVYDNAFHLVYRVLSQEGGKGRPVRDMCTSGV